MIKKAIILGLGMSLGPLLQFIATPWLARIYSPQEFGDLAFFVTVTSVLISVACMRHDVAILVVKDNQVGATSRLALLYAVFIAIVCGCLAFAGLPKLLSDIGAKAITVEALLITLAIAGGGAVLVACNLSQRRDEYITNAFLRSLQGIVYIICAFTMSWGLMNSWLAGWGIAAFFAVIYVYLTREQSPLVQLTHQAIYLKDYIFKITPAFLLDSLALALPVIFIGKWFGAADLGKYTQIYKLIAPPMLLISAVAGQLLLERTGRLYREKQSSLPVMRKLFYALSLFSFSVLILTVLLGSMITNLMLGDGWRHDTTFIVLITIPILCKTVVSPFTTIFLTHEKTKIFVRWQIAYFISTILILLISTRCEKIDSFLMIYLTSEFVAYFVCSFLIYKTIKNIKYND